MRCLLLDIRSAAVAMLLGNSLTPDADLDATLSDVKLDQGDLELLDVGFSDLESDGNQTHYVIQFPMVSSFPVFLP